VIRVLEVVATLKRAGAETLVTSLVSGLDRSRFEPAVCALFDPSPNDLEPPAPVWRLGKKAGFDPRMYSRLRKVVREFRPDIIHTHSYVMRYTLPVARCAAVHTVHNLAAREVDRAGTIVHRIGYRLGVVPVAVADEVARSVEDLYGIRPVTIRNGIDVERFHRPECRQVWRAANGFSNDDILIVSVARLEPQKNPELLIRALPESCHLLLAGDGSLRPVLEGRPRVHLLGVRKDLPELLSGCDLFALASDWEGHPIALMEAMAAGLPVVATAVGGVPEIVGDAGLLVPPGDRDALHSALENALKMREKCAFTSRKRAEMFDIRATIDAYSALFERLAQ
jgi:glycosyltransferase involved in cell wall biosynthesis